jgi:hypothetical protein
VDTVVGQDSRTNPVALRKLYFQRFAFAAVWAVALFLSADTITPASASLLLIYPLFDVVAAAVDLRSTPTVGRSASLLYANIVISSLVVIGVAVAVASGVPSVLRVWGAWAIASGLVQAGAGAVRRRLGGQWPMIISGTISAAAGASFVLQARSDDPSLEGLARYALLGGVFFLVSALRLHRVRPVT